MIWILIKSTVFLQNNHCIYGIDAGLFNRTSIQLPYLIEAARERHQAGMIAVGEVLYQKGIVQSPEVSSFSTDELDKSPPGIYSWDILGSQSNCKAERVRKLGWNPHRPTLLNSVEEQVDALINRTKD